MPKQGENILKFNNFHKQLPVPFVIYADFEAIMKKVQGCERSEEMEKDKDRRSYTEAYQTHEDCGYGYKVICCYDDKYSKYTCIYRGENAVYKFMEKMLKEVEYCNAVIKKHFNKPLVMNEVDEQNFKTMDGCHICGEKYTNKDVRVRDHCHITGKFRGSAHQECNLKLRIKPENLKIPVIFHNLRGYDSHFIMQQIGEIANKHGYTNKTGEKQDLNINAIPNNMEKYMVFMLGNHLTFIDSFQFMSSSLDKLVSNLPKDDLIYTSKAFKDKRLDLMSQKGVYPYDFMDSFEKFNQTELPNKDQFYSILNDQHITDDEYDHAKKVWKTFNVKTMGEYHDLYLVSDVLLLTDVFENFRKTCMQYYKLDPCHYFTSPGLSKRVDIRLVTNEKKLDKLTSKPTYVGSKIFNENLMAVHKVKEALTLNRLAYVGMCILDLSKTLMYNFHYNYIKKKYNNRARLLFTDTDSLTYEIEAEDVYKDFWNDKNMFDNSDYPGSSPYYCNVNKKITGKFKDEACGIPITEFIGFKSRMYSYVKDNEKRWKDC